MGELNCIVLSCVVCYYVMERGNMILSVTRVRESKGWWRCRRESRRDKEADGYREGKRG